MQKNVLEYFENTLKKHKSKIAVIDAQRELSFFELGRHAKRLSSVILKKSTACKRPIAVFLPKSADSLIAFIAILYSGNIYAPIDIKLPHGKVKSIFDNFGKTLVITSSEYFETLVSMGVDAGDLIGVDDAYDESTGNESDQLLDGWDSLIDTDPVYIIHTSGSTGVPKGVVIPHRGVIDYIDWAIDCFEIGPDTIIGSQSPFYFDNSTLDIYLCMAAGATLVIIPEQNFAFPVKLMEYVKSKNINFIFWVPSVMINVANTKALDIVDVSALEKVLFAGEVMPNRHLNYWRQKLPNALYANLYGPTEITVDCTYYIVKRSFEDNEKLPIGFPCRNSDILILNNENQMAKKDEIGELCVRGSSLALGYWNDQVKSEEVFTQNPLNTNYYDRIYRTGDLVFMNDQKEIIYMDRKDSQIKHMGHRIELGEIETAVSSIEGIHNACALYNKEKKEITLFYESNVEAGKEGIRKSLIPLLPKYMIPTKMIKIDMLPINPNGKIDRKRIAMEWFESEHA